MCTVILIGTMLVSCGEEPAKPIDKTEPLVKIPQGFPEIVSPPDNILTKDKIALGRILFYDKQLSRDGSVACVDCHKQHLAFTDGLPVSKGVGGEIGARNSPTIVNSAYSAHLFLDARAQSLEVQIREAMFSPLEMYADENMIDEYLNASKDYKERFTASFGTDSVPKTSLAVKAIAAFVRTVISGNSRYDRYTRGEKTALTDNEIAGMKLFFSERTQCASCHKGFNFTDDMIHSTGLYVHYYDKGRGLITGNPKDEGTFKTPSLRNCGLTAPFMHDGSVATLEKTLEHYNHGGKAFKNKDERIVPLHLTEQEQSDLIAFLHSLTDDELIKKQEYSAP